MTNLLMTLLYFTIAVAILIAIHEYGHFLIARVFGVKVLRFSLGFGKAIVKWQGNKGTEYVLAAIPLGGYVKMLDENEEPVPPELLSQAFNRKSVWIRIAVVISGPVFNILFAIFALWLMFIIGINSMAPIIGDVKPHSIAAASNVKNGDEIIAINTQPVNSWRTLQLQLMPLYGNTDPVEIRVHNITSGEYRNLKLNILHWQLDTRQPDLLDSLGITPKLPTVPPVIGAILPNNPAAKSGLKAQDRIIKINGKKVNNWNEVVNTIQKQPNRAVTLTVKRDQTMLDLLVTPRGVVRDGKELGFIGAQSAQVNWPTSWIRVAHYSPSQALLQSLNETWMLTKTTFLVMEKFILGKISLRSISGPIGIAQGASQSAQVGFSSYLYFLALISVSLGVLNILPIPMLDGGHLFYYVYEAVFKKPVSETSKMIGMQIGLLLLLALMLLAFFNDISRLIS